MLPKKRPPIHPGQILLTDFLVPKKIMQKDFAKHLKWSYARLNEIINGRRGVSVMSALALADALKIEPIFWLNLQRDWDLWQAIRSYKNIKPFKQAFRP